MCRGTGTPDNHRGTKLAKKHFYIDWARDMTIVLTKTIDPEWRHAADHRYRSFTTGMGSSQHTVVTPLGSDLAVTGPK